MKNPMWVQSYLHKLQLPQEQPSISYLERICQAHLFTIPFENISKLIYWRERERNRFNVPPLDIFVHHLYTMQLGGTCYILNPNLQQLLLELGFSATLIPVGDSHIAILVDHPEEPGVPLYVDMGSAAPFFKPVDFTRQHDNCSSFAGIDVRLVPDETETGIYRFKRYRLGELVSDKWSFNPAKTKNLPYFNDTIAKSYQLETNFMSSLICQLFQRDKQRHLFLKNNLLTITYEDKTSEEINLHRICEIEAVLAEEFLLPKIPVREATRILQELGVDIFAQKSQ
ncbi:arylamine N-acetyltransferase [Brevibacillus daliensis]|uniref:arylamine N-acetyltransferase n=1 Tax=Brevibacillus daliensis TaxID=2892995 RepID=UPI001E41D7AC|nr:arylamine N-acetyltransferase [Brevibacillus daliensis]